MGLRDVFNWWSHTTTNLSYIPHDHSLMDNCHDGLIDPLESTPKPTSCEFFRSNTLPKLTRNHSSLLTKAINSYNIESCMDKSSEPLVEKSMSSRPRSSMSNTSLELTSDGGTISSSSSNTPTFPLDEQQPEIYFDTEKKAMEAVATKVYPARISKEKREKSVVDSNQPAVGSPSEIASLATTESSQLVSPRKRSIAFECNKVRPSIINLRTRSNSHPILRSQTTVVDTTSQEESCIASQKPRRPTIKFVCSGPQPIRLNGKSKSISAPLSPSDYGSTKSPFGLTSMFNRKLSEPIARINSLGLAPKYQIQNNLCINDVPGSSQATRFHEFASEEVELDDWLRQDVGLLESKLTINDMLRKEIELRRLASEVEAEEELEDEETEMNGDYSEDEFEEDEDEKENNFDFEFDSSDGGNETDNEAGFADSDESDAEEETLFWIPGNPRCSPDTTSNHVSDDTVSIHYRADSDVSIDSVQNLQNVITAARNKRNRRPSKKMRPGTPDLPDSTDFVCGTLDEDRPLEDAYLSCLEIRKLARHKLTPQDIDPSFPTSDVDHDDDDAEDTEYNMTNVGARQRRRSSGRSKEVDNVRFSRASTRNHPSNNCYSPKKLHSPPPPKSRLRSPPPRKLYRSSPKRMYPSTPLNEFHQTITSARAISFAPLGIRTGLTHTKSLPRTPSFFGHEYRGLDLNPDDDCDIGAYDNNDSHMRGAIDIVKGLEQRRQRRKEKLYMKQNNRRARGHLERKPQPGIGAERMREIGLIMAGKAGERKTYILSA